jgi:TPR repeat protein
MTTDDDVFGTNPNDAQSRLIRLLKKENRVVIGKPLYYRVLAELEKEYSFLAARYHLGLKLLTGDCINQDVYKAIKYLKEAEEEGYAKATEKLLEIENILAKHYSTYHIDG